ncbi:MAG: glycoside hydrolase family 92 protein, partial [Bifidobacteriaceae bacterium]|nr:glycoside hydrolase family 92 protein [Bifidobacteriaceae bacterium]
TAKTGTLTATETNAEVRPGKMYVNNGFWDTYRTAWPLYAALYPDLAAELVDGFVEQYRAGGWISRWSSPGYSDMMTGTSSDAAFAEVYTAGSLPTSIALDAYDAAVKNATVLPTSPYTGVGAGSVGRKQFSTSPYTGYTSTSQGESVSWGMEGYINDYAIGLMARELAVDPATPPARVQEISDMADYLLARAANYTNYYDPEVDFFQGITSSGAFLRTPETYDPMEWLGPYTETDGWNFAFHAPYDPAGLAFLYGGQDALVAKLLESEATPDLYDRTGGNAKEQHDARDVRMGQIGLSNQVSFHIPYIAAAAGKPSVTQRLIREATSRLQTGEDIGQGYIGDEDNGAMASFFLYSNLGFYPMSLGSGEYLIGSPAYDQVKIVRPDGTLTVRAPGNSHDTVYVQSATLDGQPLTSAIIAQDALLGTGNHTLEFQMGSAPSTWGETPDPSAKPEPLRDAAKAGQGTVAASDGSAVGALFDDSSTSRTTFTTATPTLTWRSSIGPVAVAQYTLTSGATGSTPSAWTLHGSTDGGDTWTQLDARTEQAFTWPTQLRPFTVATPDLYNAYQLRITATSDGEPATLGELEFLADPAFGVSGALTLYQAEEILTTVSAAGGLTLGRAVGGDADQLSGTVEFGDGTQAPLVITPGAIGGYSLGATHTYPTSGIYDATVTVSDGATTNSEQVRVYARYLDGIGDLYDSSCFVDVGSTATCDDAGTGYSLARLAAAGSEGGVPIALGTTGLTFTPPAVGSGDPDNVTTLGASFPLHLGTGATQISFIGTGTNATSAGIGGTGTITYSDGTTQSVTVRYGDWAPGSSDITPIAGTGKLVQIDRRVQGGTEPATPGAAAAIFYTTPVALQPGKTAVQFTMPATITGGDAAKGLLHVFGVATDGTPAAPLTVTAASAPTAKATAVTAVELGAVADGDGPGPRTARINWGDGSDLTSVPVSVSGTVTASHAYPATGTYTAWIVVDDGLSTARTPAQITVVGADLTDLAALVAASALYVQGATPGPAWTTFQTTRAEAAALAGTTPSASDIEVAYQALAAAIAALVPASTAAVEALTDAAKHLDPADYSAGVGALMEAITGAEQVAAAAAAQQASPAQVGSAYAALFEAISGLVRNAGPVPLQAAVDLVDGTLAEGDYTAATWSQFETALDDAKALLANSAALAAASQAQLNGLEQALADAVDALVRRGDTTSLAAVVAAVDGVHTQSHYTPATWSPFTAALTSARTVLGKAPQDVSRAEADAALGALNTALAGLRPTTGGAADAATLNAAIAGAEALAARDYTPASWAGLAAPLAEARRVAATASVAQAGVDAAARALSAAVAALVRVTDRSALAQLVAEVASSGLGQAGYTPASWGALVQARQAAEAALTGAPSQVAVDSAFARLADALFGLTPTVPTATGGLTAAIAAVSADVGAQGSYTPASWSRYTSALADAQAVAANAQATQAQVDAALASLTAAIGGLRALPQETPAPGPSPTPTPTPPDLGVKDNA